MSQLILVAPLQGWSTPLDELPDAVFAGRMLGDGLAIDPTGTTLYAPCDGELIAVPASRHAITLRAPNGVEVLLHVGIDTVSLGGEGFQMHVRQGQQVRTGERLLSFDLDLLARRAKSLLTPILVLEGCGFTMLRSSQNREVQPGDFLLEVGPAAAVAEQVARSPGVRVSRRLQVHLEHGIHARPAALVVSSIKAFAADVSVVLGGREANARSTVSLMSLGVRRGDEVEVRAVGPDAAAALDALEAALRAGDGGAQGHRAAGSPGPAVPPRVVARSNSSDLSLSGAAASQASAAPDAHTLRGVIASRGLTIGQAVQFSRPEITVPEVGAGVSHENAEFDRARAAVKARLERALEAGSGATREIVGAHLELIEDPELIVNARAWIAKGFSAGYAWRHVIRLGVEALRGLGDARMAERVDDLIDLESQVLLELRGESPINTRQLPDRAILIAGELLPSQLVAFDAAKVAGICMAAGGPTSHVSILAAAMGVPALVAVGPGVLSIPDGASLILDAEGGCLHVEPEEAQLESVRAQLAARAERYAAELAAAQRECHTTDGARIEVFANVGSAAEAHAAVRNGAEGCGLLRTEFLFLERQQPPDELEQLQEYQKIAAALAGRPLTLRTLDIGGDKPIPYLPLPHEDNPALGLRGIRTSLWNPELLRVQLRAVLAITPAEHCRILLPMITDPAEIRTVKSLLEELRREEAVPGPLGSGPMGVGAMRVGVMIETPASAVMADRIAAEADFFSIGTNDLTQYTLAMDRGHPELAARLDGLHPAVLRLIARTVEAAQPYGRPVAVCGGLASDAHAVPILIGLGVHELSAVPSVIPQIKTLIRGVSLEECRALARQALEQESAEAVRSLAVSAFASSRAGEVTAGTVRANGATP